MASRRLREMRPKLSRRAGGWWRCWAQYLVAWRELPGAFRIGPRLLPSALRAHIGASAPRVLLKCELPCYGHPQALNGPLQVASLLVGFGEFDEQFQVQPPKLSSLLLRPLLIAVARQQIPRVEIQCSPVCRGIP